MRSLRNGEYPVLPVGYQNLRTGQNRDFNVIQSWGGSSGSVSLIEFENHRTGEKSLRLILSGNASQQGELAHDQTHNYIGRFKLVKEYYGTSVQFNYSSIFKQIMDDTGKTSLPAYVFK